ncbi:hypothetical protein L7F22_040608 [Adiantum nelumboides]|nr:hypothetical protein [Adiantum nelumboides]
MTMSPRISKWLMELQSYEYTFKVENSVRAQLVGILTYRLHEKVIKVPNVRPLPPPPPKVLSNAYTLFFDGAFRRATGKAGGGLVLVNPEGEVVMKEQVTLDGSTINNEAEYDVLISGLKICLAQKIRRLMVKGDALLILEQILGIWACKNERLRTKVTSIHKLFSQFEEVQFYHIPRKENEDADLLAQQAVSNQDKAHVVIAAIALKDSQYAGMESLTPVVNYILEGELPKEFTTGQRRKLIKQASTFLWLEGALNQKGKDLFCRRVPSTNEIPKILKDLHEEACEGHFSHELTLKKVLLARYVWLSMHADVQHWCRSCHNCQVNGNKRLLYGPRQAVIANGPFEKWGIDAMGPLPRTANEKLYILVAIDYMTRFGTPLEIVSARVSKRSSNKILNMAMPKLAVQEFSMQEIKRATNNFHTKLGQGGFGPVYKGCLQDGRFVAIKVASNIANQGTREFLNEVDLLSRVHHKNLVGLVGFCNEQKLVLVYEFMSNGSLFDCLHGPYSRASPLSWHTRLRIMVDAAQGLDYLHHGCNPRIIHRDVKSSNILLNDKMEAKISDFGISRDYIRSETGALSTSLMGSMGYIDPEYMSSTKLTEKVDVYSFGVLLFEVVCGQPAIFKDSSHEPTNLVEWALKGKSSSRKSKVFFTYEMPLLLHWYKHYCPTGPTCPKFSLTISDSLPRKGLESLLNGNSYNCFEQARTSINRGVIDEIVDVSLHGQYDVLSVWKVVEVALACVEFQSFKRPKMSEIYLDLKEAERLELESGERNAIDQTSVEFTGDSNHGTLSYTHVSAR